MRNKVILNRVLAILAVPLCVFSLWAFQTPVAMYVHMKIKAFCAVGSVITAFTEKFPADAAAPVSSQNFGFFEAIRFQGVTTDGDSWYYSWNLGLMKTDIKHRLTGINFVATPIKYLRRGLNHIGGISVWGGRLYCPIEDNANFRDPTITVYDAKTLRFIEAHPMPWELHTEGVPWVAVDGPRALVYTAEWAGAEVLNIFKLDDFSLVKTLPLSQPIDRVQGGEVFGDILYCSSDNDSRKSVYAVNVLTGEVTLVFDRNLGERIEAEDLTVLPMGDGSLLHCMEIGSLFMNLRFNHYALP